VILLGTSLYDTLLIPKEWLCFQYLAKRYSQPIKPSTQTAFSTLILKMLHFDYHGSLIHFVPLLRIIKITLATYL